MLLATSSFTCVRLSSWAWIIASALGFTLLPAATFAAQYALTDFAGRHLPSEGASSQIAIRGPDGIAVDGRGNIWYTAGGRLYMVGSDRNAKAVLSPYGYTFGRSILPLPNGSIVVESAPSIWNLLVVDERQNVVPLFDGKSWSVPVSVTQNTSNGGVGIDSSGALYFAGDHAVRQVETGKAPVLYAGKGLANFFGDGQAATDAGVRNPQGIAWDASGNLFIADTDNCRVRKVDKNRIISTLAGVGCEYQPATKGGPGIGRIAAIAYHPSSNSILAVAEELNTVWRIGQDGKFVRLPGTEPETSSGSTRNALWTPSAIAVAPDNSIWIAERDAGRLRRIAPDGSTSFVGASRFAGDGSAATEALLNSPVAGAVGPDGSYYFSDRGNNRIRRVLRSGVIITVAGTGA